MIFRRRNTEPDEAPESASAEDQVEAPSARRQGPWDRAETDADTDEKTYVDLGGLVVRGAPGLELRLQVDESSGAVVAVLLAGAESGLELRAFAAPRSTGIWDEVRHDIAAEAARRGGSATELHSGFGVELNVVVPATTPDGRQATQTSRIVGIDGPRWMLRGTFLGKVAEERGADEALEQAFRDVIVVRGDAPMAPRTMLVMRMPETTRSAWEEPIPSPGAHGTEQ